MGMIGAVWGVLGISLLFGSALFRLYPYAAELRGATLSPVHWAALAGCLLLMGYAEGYRGFHLRFSPRAAARALYLKNHPAPLRIVFAPLFCMGFFHAARRRKTTAFALTAIIILLIMLVRRLPPPWRGIVDAGVVLGLGWGIVSLWWFTLRAFADPSSAVSPETPGSS